MLHIINSLVIAGSRNINPNNPLIGYDNRVDFSNVSATSADASHPATDLANPATNLYWQASDTSEQLVTVNIGSTDRASDYVGLARSNFGSAGIQVSLEGNVGAGWFEIVPGFVPGDDGPRILRFTRNYYTGIRLRLKTGSAAARLAILFVGKALIMPRRLYVGHAPINLQESWRATNGMAESGDFLGRIILGSSAGTTIALRNLPAGWVRTYFKPFMDAAAEDTFFYAWRPQDYPLEVGYCWLSNPPKPSNQLSNGQMQVDVPVGGIVS